MRWSQVAARSGTRGWALAALFACCVNAAPANDASAKRDLAKAVLNELGVAARFDTYRDVDDLIAAIHALPPFKQPGILPEQIAGIPAKLPRLVS